MIRTTLNVFHFFDDVEPTELGILRNLSTQVESPPGEAERLVALGRLMLLDTDPEERFDRLTRLTAGALDAPVAMFNLVDAGRQWTKSASGIERSTIPRSQSFCALTIEGERTFVIPDTHGDPRFVDNPFVQGEPGIRFYAGHPIHSPDGHRIGTLCVLDFEPRVVTEAQLVFLDDLASVLESELERVDLVEALNENVRLESRFATVFARSSEALILVDPDGMVIHANDGLNHHLGYPTRTINGQNYPDYVHPDDLPLMEKLFSTLVEDAQAVRDSIEMRFRSSNGSWRWFELWLHDLSTDEAVGALLISARDVTDHLELASTQRESNDRLHAALKTSRNGFLEFDSNGDLVAPYDNLPRFLGLGGLSLRNMSDIDSVLVDSTGQPFSVDRRPIANALRQGSHLADEIVGIRPQELSVVNLTDADGGDHEVATYADRLGGVRWLSLSTAPLVVGEQVHTILTVKDVSSVRKLERDLAEQHRRYELIFEHATDILAVVDSVGRVKFSSPATQRVLGLDVEYGRPGGLLSIIHPEDRNIINDVFAKVASNRWDNEERVVVRIATASGDWVYLEATATNLLLEPTIEGILITARDVTSRELLTQALAHQAMRDPLTGIFNRRAFGEGLDSSLARTARRAENIALVWIDLNDFKAVNDQYGHAAGDTVLVNVAQRLTSIVRAGDIVGRFGGDEFAIVLEPITGLNDAVAMAERVREVLSAPMLIDGVALVCLPSIGLAMSGNGATSDALMARADEAMYSAKREGGAQIAVG